MPLRVILIKWWGGSRWIYTIILLNPLYNPEKFLIKLIHSTASKNSDLIWFSFLPLSLQTVERSDMTLLEHLEVWALLGTIIRIHTSRFQIILGILNFHDFPPKRAWPAAPNSNHGQKLYNYSPQPTLHPRKCFDRIKA